MLFRLFTKRTVLVVLRALVTGTCAQLVQLVAAQNVFAQQGLLETIIVTPVPGQGVARNTVAGNVQVATANDLYRSRAADLAGFMNRRFGSVHVNDVQNNPFQSDLNFRGFTASPLLGTAQGLSVYLDGVRLNQAFGDVVSWDLIPRSAIATMALMPGSNPAFGLNTLGGAINASTKDGMTHAGTAVQMEAGSYGRKTVEFEHGGNSVGGWHWFASGQGFEDDGWRVSSPSSVRQLFGKLGWQGGRGGFALSLAVADNELYGNGLQEMRLWAEDDESVYTLPDITTNRGALLNLTGSYRLNSDWAIEGNVFARVIDTDTLNGDINEEALTQSLYQPNAAELAALAKAGYGGFPLAGENAANTAFPRWRCIGQALLQDEPGEKCTGLINTSVNNQDNAGFNLQMHRDAPLWGFNNQLIVGAAYDHSSVDFVQETELGYLLESRAVQGIGVFADGENAGDLDGEPFDNRVDLSARTSTWSVFASNTLDLNAVTHLTMSARFNQTRVTNRDAINPGGGPGSLDGDHRFSRLNPAIGLTRELGDGFTVYAAANQGSRAPSAIELGCADPASPCKLPNSMAGDPPLQQVVATTTELGMRHIGDIEWNLGLFRTLNRDDILFVADDMAGYGYFRNFGRTLRQGLEAGIATQIGAFTLGGNYSRIDATFQSGEILGGASNSSNEMAAAGKPGVEGEIEIEPGNYLPLIPRQMVKLFASWQIHQTLSLNADITAMEGVYARGNENNQHAADGMHYIGPGQTTGYTVVNLGVEWHPQPSLQVFAQVNNVFDRYYMTAAQLGAAGIKPDGSFQARPFQANANGDYPLEHSTFCAPAAPRMAWIGVRYNF